MDIKKNIENIYFYSTTGYPEIAKLLKSKGAYVNTVDNKRNTHLHLAVQGDTDEHYAVAEVLIANTDVNARNADNKTPLDLASNEQSNLIQQFLQIQKLFSIHYKFKLLFYIPQSDKIADRPWCQKI